MRCDRGFGSSSDDGCGTRQECALMAGHGVYETATGLNPALANVVRAWSDGSWQPAGRTRLRGMKADTPYHVPSETR